MLLDKVLERWMVDHLVASLESLLVECLVAWSVVMMVAWMG